MILSSYGYQQLTDMMITSGFSDANDKSTIFSAAALSTALSTVADIKASATAVTCIVTNNGTVAGEEAAQLYLGYPESAGEPPKVCQS